MYDKIRIFFKCLIDKHDWKLYKGNKDRRTGIRPLMRKCANCGRVDKKAAKWEKVN